MKISLTCTLTAAEFKTVVRGPLPADTPVSLTVTRQIDDERGDWLDLEATIRARVSSPAAIPFAVEPIEIWDEPDGSTGFRFDHNSLTDCYQAFVLFALEKFRKTKEQPRLSGSLTVNVLDPNQARVDPLTRCVDTADENLAINFDFPLTTTAQV